MHGLFLIAFLSWQPTNENDDEDDEDEDEFDDNNSTNMIVDAPEAPPPHLKSADMPVDEPKASNPKATEADDGWVVVSSKRNRGKRNWDSHTMWFLILLVWFFFLMVFDLFFPLCVLFKFYVPCGVLFVLNLFIQSQFWKENIFLLVLFFTPLIGDPKSWLRN